MRVPKTITIDPDLWAEAAEQAAADDVTMDEYLTWLLCRDRRTLPMRRRDEPLSVVNNTLQALLTADNLSARDEANALRTLELAEAILQRLHGVSDGDQPRPDRRDT